MSDNFTTEKTIENFSNGDEKALDIIFRRYHAPLLYFAQQLIHNKEEAEDKVLETFGKLWKLHENFDTENNIKAFLYITTRNQCFNYLRSSQRKKTILTDPNETFDDHIEARDTYLDAEVLRQLYNEIEKLPQRSREILKMLYFEGMTAAQIAVRLDIETDTVYSQKRHAIETLRKHFINKKFTAAVILLMLLESRVIPFSKNISELFADFDTSVVSIISEDQTN
jgi:RNA polymerase sigma-70 factor (family 1)